MQKTIFLHVWLLPALLVFSGCGREKLPATNPEKPEESQRVIAVCLADLESPWQLQLKADLENEAQKHSNIRLVFNDADSDAQKPTDQLAMPETTGADLLILNPVSSHNTADGLFDRGIPIIVLDRPLIGDKYSCFIGADPRSIGEMAGKWLADKLQGKGKIVELRGPVDSFWDNELHAGWRVALRDPGFRFVFNQHIDPPKIDAAELMADALKAIEEIDAVFAYDDAAGYEAFQTAKTAEREKDVLFIGVGGLPKLGEAYVAQGILSATVLKPTGGQEAIDAAMKILDGGQVPQKITLPSKIISR